MSLRRVVEGKIIDISTIYNIEKQLHILTTAKIYQFMVHLFHTIYRE